MNLKSTFSVFTLLLLQTLFCYQSNAQNSAPTDQFSRTQSFIENKGQFDGKNWRSDLNIEYAIEYNGFSMYFNREGFTYRLDKFIRNREEHDRDAKAEGKAKKPKWTNISELINTTWLGSNSGVVINAQEPASHYYSYTYRKGNSKEYFNENHVNGFKKLIYKNLYANVDVDYEIHPGKGIKYNITLHPGANASAIQLKYENYHTKARAEFVKYFLDPSGNFIIQTSLDKITELKPFAYYKDSGKEIKAHFKFENDILSFELENYDHSKEVIIDPWVVNSTFNSSTAVWEVETDAIGNVYVIGGETPMTLEKYNSAGTLVWAHPTPWDTATVWLGTLATDNFGTSYITSGTAPEMQRVDNTGATVWTQTGPTGLSGDAEWWSITFNCDKTKLIVGGTTLNMLAFEAFATIFDMDINSGNVLTSQYLDTADLSGFGANPIEVRSISSSKNAKYIFLTHNDVGAINQNIGACPTDAPVFQLDNGYNLSYKCENYLPASQNGGGLKAIVANDQFFYTSSGAQIFKRSLSNGALITSAAIPSGANSTDIFGKKVVENSGLAVDSCGNVYAGSKGKVIKFDKDLNILSQATVSFTVYDVSVNSNGEVIAVGAQNNNSSTSRNGRIESLNMGACTQYELVCCDANICPTNNLCLSSSAVTLSTTTPGGTFSGSGITNSSTGVFNPSVAGVGTHTVIYSQSCGSDSVSIVVNSCLALTACQENNGNVTATSGNGPYTWYEWASGSTIQITDQASCTACGGQWFIFQCMINGSPATSCTGPSGWAQFGGTGTTVTPTANWPILVVDADNDSLQIASLGSLPMCTPCTPPTASATATATSCGQNNGTATASATGGSTPYTYSWSNGATTASVTGLAAGSYIVTITGGGCNDTASVTVTSSAGVTATATATSASCSSNNGTATANPSGGSSPYTYSWSNSQTSQTATGLGAGNYSVTVTDNSGCSANASVTVSSSSGMTGTATANNTSCGNNNGSATANPSGGASPYTYAWSNSQTTQTITGLASGTYSVTITDNNGCTVTSSATVNSSTGVNASATATNTSCGSNNGTATASQTGGSSPYTYSWSNGATTVSLSGLSAGTYTVTITDSNSCTDTASATVTSSSGLSATTSSNQASCGSSNGSALVTPSGGASPYTYLWSNGQTTGSITGLAAGNYSVTVTDNAGCTFVASATVGSGGGPSAAATATGATCNGTGTGSATATPSGGVSPYTYLWSNGQTGQTATGLTAGNYTVTVTDAGACTATANTTVSEPTAIAASTTTVDAACGSTDGSATVTASGGTTPYSYLWNNGQTSLTATSLGAASYTVTITDANGCTQTASAIVGNPNAPVVNATPVSPSCSGGNNGSASLTITGGTTPYSYQWSNSSTTQNVSGLSAGTYTVTVSDNAGCNAINSVTVTDPPPVPAQITSNDSIVCSGGNASLLAVGGSTYNWSTGQTGPSITVSNITSVTTIVVTVTDANSCVGTANFQISPVSVTISNPPTLCPGDSAMLVATGGNTYVWSTTETNDTIVVSPSSDSTYYVSESTLGCNNVDSVTVSVSPGPAPIVSNDTTIGYGASVQIVAEGGEYYLWNTGETTPSITVSPEVNTTYSVIVVDEYGCRDTVLVNITVECRHAISIPTIFSPNGDGLNETIRVHGYGIAEISFVIYDRWGEKIFETTDKDQVWDGTRKGRPLNSAVFVYILKVTFCDGIEYDEKGNITLVR